MGINVLSVVGGLLVIAVVSTDAASKNVTITCDLKACYMKPTSVNTARVLKWNDFTQGGDLTLDWLVISNFDYIETLPRLTMRILDFMEKGNPAQKIAANALNNVTLSTSLDLPCNGNSSQLMGFISTTRAPTVITQYCGSILKIKLPKDKVNHVDLVWIADNANLQTVDNLASFLDANPTVRVIMPNNARLGCPSFYEVRRQWDRFETRFGQLGGTTCLSHSGERVAIVELDVDAEIKATEKSSSSKLNSAETKHSANFTFSLCLTIVSIITRLYFN